MKLRDATIFIIRITICFFILIECFLYSSPVQAEKPKITDDASCLACHEGIETLDADHAFACALCHLKPKDRGHRLSSHQAVIRYPAAPGNAERFCIPCHQKEIAAVNHSLHYTLAGMINQTRYLWGAQSKPSAQYAAGDHAVLKPLPPTPAIIRTPADLADDLLRNRCLNCHAGRVPPSARGLYRGVGCAACHLPYADDGIYRGNDLAMIGKKGYARVHRFCNPIGTKQCLHCHNGPRVGADYVGYFEHDHHQSYRTPIQNGALAAPVYLMDHHRLQPDVHHLRGLLCIDCHGREDVMGSGAIYAGQHEAVRIRCQYCHGPFEALPDNRLRRKFKKGRFRSHSGKRFQAPPWTPNTAAHAISEMKNVHCLGCHAGWGFNDYGPDLLRDDRGNLNRWRPWRLQGDAGVAKIFDTPNPPAEDGSLSSGVWLSGWRFRRWEFLSLGCDEQGIITPFRPRYQYLVSYINGRGQVIIDSIAPQRGDGSGKGWACMPFHPHTVQKRGRSCEACHGEPMAAGLGVYNGQSADLLLTRPDPPVYPCFKLLDRESRQKLMNKSPVYRTRRFTVLWQECKR